MSDSVITIQLATSSDPAGPQDFREVGLGDLEPFTLERLRRSAMLTLAVSLRVPVGEISDELLNKIAIANSGGNVDAMILEDGYVYWQFDQPAQGEHSRNVSPDDAAIAELVLQIPKTERM